MRRRAYRLLTACLVLLTAGTASAGGAPEIPRLRRSLLLIVGAIGSVSALAGGLAEVRRAVELFGEAPRG